MLRYLKKMFLVEKKNPRRSNKRSTVRVRFEELEERCVPTSTPTLSVIDAEQTGPGLIAQWTFNSSSASDSTNNHPGNLEYSPSFPSNVSPAFSGGTALALNGTSQYVSVPDSNAFSLGGGDFTMSAWINWSTVTNGAVFMGQDAGAGNNPKWLFGYGIAGQTAGDLMFLYGGGTGNPTGGLECAWTPRAGQWYNVAITRVSGTFTLYIDGTEAAYNSSNNSIVHPSAPLTIGWASEPGAYFPGEMNDVRMYSRGLTPNEVATLANGVMYDGSSFPAAATVAGTNGVYAANLEGTIPTLTYYTGTNTNGTPLSGAPTSAGTYTVVENFAGNSDYASASAQTTFTIDQDSTTTSLATNADALSLNGTNQYVNVGNPSALKIASQITLSCWFEANPGDNGMLISKNGPGGGSMGYYLYVGGNSLVFGLSSNGTTQTQVIGTITPGVVYDVTATWNGSIMTLYLNGSSVGTASFTGSINNTAANFLIGAAYPNNLSTPGFFFGGLIDGVRVYNTALTSTLVAQLYGSGGGLATAGSDSAYLAGWWKLNEGTGGTAYDSSSSGNNGALTNTPTWVQAPLGMSPPVVYGQNVTFTATVASSGPGVGPPTGTVQFQINGSNYGSPVPLSGGQASISDSALSLGNNTVTATYSGDTNFLGSSFSSSPLAQAVNQDNTATTLASSVSPSVYGQGVTFTATVAASSPGSGTPTGTVQFQINGSNYGSPAALSGGQASIGDSTLLPGSYTITASYSGDTNFIASTAGTLTQTVNQSSSTTSVSSSLSPSVYGQNVTFTATVAAGGSGSGTPTGSVQFQIDGSNYGSPVTLSNGQASISDAALLAGSHTITASYSGNANFTSSNDAASPLTQTVDQDSTTSTVASSAAPSVYGQNITFTATVAANSPGSGTPTGTVQFQINGNNFGNPVPLSSGQATISDAGLAPGNYSISDIYSGDSNFAGSDDPLTQTVNQAGTTTTVASAASSVYGQSVTFTATVAANSAGSGTPTGTVQFQIDGSNYGSPVTLGNGQATISDSNLFVGAHTIDAVYSGDGNFQTSGSGSQDLTVTPQITVAATVLSGHEVELTGVLSDSDPGGATVEFSGAVSGQTTTNLNGAFTYFTTQATLGTVDAVGVDQQGLQTNTASASIATPAPTLAVSIVSVGAGTLTLSGQLTGIDPTGETVSISGPFTGGGTTCTTADGSFTYTADVAATGTFSVSAGDLWGQTSNVVAGSVTAVSPTVTASLSPQLTLNAQVLPGHEVLLTGTLSDDVPDGATVTFSGAAAGTAVTDANGNFSFLTTDATLGTVEAVAVDQNEQTSNTASAQIATAAPLLSMRVTNVGDGTATVTGNLADVDLAGETIQYSGLASGTATTDANGNFTFTISTSAVGNLTANVTDEWGQQANHVSFEVPEQEFEITDFDARQLVSGWLFEGQVVGSDDLQNVEITFGGLSAINGVTVQAGADGFFCVVRPLTIGTVGNATAQAYDPDTLTMSNVMDTLVHNTVSASVTPNLLDRGNPVDAAGQNVLVAFDGDNPADDPLTFTAAGLPNGLSINPDTGIVSGTVADNAVSSTPYSVSITAEDAYGNEASESFSWTITQSSLTAQPVGSISAVAGVSTGTITVATFTTTDLNSQAGDFIATVYWGDGNSDQAEVSGSNGSFTVTDSHTYNATGSFPVSVVISNIPGAMATVSVDGTTAYVASPVSLTSPGDQTSTEGDTLSPLQLTAADQTNGTLTFSAVNLPAGLTIDSSGLVSGTLTADVGDYDVTVTVTDGTFTTIETFVWTVVL